MRKTCTIHEEKEKKITHQRNIISFHTTKLRYHLKKRRIFFIYSIHMKHIDERNKFLSKVKHCQNIFHYLTCFIEKDLIRNSFFFLRYHYITRIFMYRVRIFIIPLFFYLTILCGNRIHMHILVVKKKRVLHCIGKKFLQIGRRIIKFFDRI